MLLAAILSMVAALPAAAAQGDDRPADADRTCVEDVMVIADAAAPQFSTGAVRVMWDALPDDRRTGDDVVYEVYRARAEDAPGNAVSLTNATFLGTTTDTQFRDITGEQDETYVWAVAARGDVQDEDPDACTGEDIRVFHPREFDNQFDETLPEVCTLHAEALPDGVIRLTWSHAGDEYAIYRSAGGDPDGGMSRDARVSGGELYTDDLIPGVTYRFGVTVWNEETETETARCNTVEVTAIPFFPNPAVIGLAGIGAIGAVLVLGRRRG